MSSYVVKPGDTFASIARRVYGSEQYAGLVAKANPGATSPVPGAALATPPRPGGPPARSGPAPAANPSEVSIEVAGSRFRFWDDLRITRAFDSIDTVQFSAPFESDAPGFRESFRPFGFAPVQIAAGGATLFTGTMVDVAPDLGGQRKALQVSGYGLPGVLADCTAPASAFPLEYDQQSLRAIAASLLEPFGLSAQFDGGPGAPFERVALSPGGEVLPFLVDLAKQRSLVIGSTPDGALVFRQSSATGAPVAELTQGASPLLSVAPTFRPQRYYSSVTGLEPVIIGLAGAQHTARNPHLPDVVRPYTFEAPDVVGGGLQTAVEAKAGRMFCNVASYAVAVSTWRDSGGALWAPGTTVQVHAPDAMIYEPYSFLLRSVSFHRNAQGGETADLELVLPGAFSGEMPEALPWD